MEKTYSSMPQKDLKIIQDELKNYNIDAEMKSVHENSFNIEQIKNISKNNTNMEIYPEKLVDDALN